jgi:uncharacterized protein with PQ loop repeat
MNNTLLTILGLCYSVLFAICYLPQTFTIIKNKSSKNIAIWTYWLCEIAYLLAIIYTLNQFGVQLVLLANYVSGFVMCSSTIFCYYLYKPVDK